MGIFVLIHDNRYLQIITVLKEDSTPSVPYCLSCTKNTMKNDNAATHFVGTTVLRLKKVNSQNPFGTITRHWRLEEFGLKSESFVPRWTAGSAALVLFSVSHSIW